jgi:hypothetical protein
MQDMISAYRGFLQKTSARKEQSEDWLDEAYPPKGEAEGKANAAGEEAGEIEEEEEDEAEEESHEHRD